jgi:hypothetical protein
VAASRSVLRHATSRIGGTGRKPICFSLSAALTRQKDTTGGWRLYWRAVRDHGSVDDTPTSYSGKWVGAGERGKPGTPLAPGQAPDPFRHLLELADVAVISNSF